MATTTYPFPKRNLLVLQIITAVLGGLTLFLTVVIMWTIGFQLMYAGRIFPGVSGS